MPLDVAPKDRSTPDCASRFPVPARICPASPQRWQLGQKQGLVSIGKRSRYPLLRAGSVCSRVRLTVLISPRRPSNGSRQTGGFFDQKNDSALGALCDLNLIAGFPDQIGDVDHRQRVGTANFQKIARRQRLQRLSRFQCRQRAFQSGEIEFCSGHGSIDGEGGSPRQRTSAAGLSTSATCPAVRATVLAHFTTSTGQAAS
jgi:hypothetical protein